MSFDRHTKIAFLGMGLMGSRMATRLLQAGLEVAVWNRTSSACDALIDLGATDLALQNIAEYPVVLTCLADDKAALSVYEQIEPFLTAKQVIIDFSSLSVEQTLSLAARAEQKQVQWIQDLSLIYNILSQRVTCMGNTGTGQATKICNQLIVAANSTLIAEAVALAAKAGVDTRLLAPALAGGFADSKPFQILSPRMATHLFEPVQWKVQTLSKDLNNAVQLAAQHQLDIPVAARALQQLQAHQQQGYAEADLASVILQVEQKAK